MKPQNNGNAIHTDLLELTVAVSEQHDPVDAADAGSPAAETPTWTTRADALKAAAGNKKPIFLLGGALAAAIVLFAITTLVGKTPHKKVAAPQRGDVVPTASADRPKGSVTPVMDTIHNPASSNTTGQLTPADINRTKASSGIPVVAAAAPSHSTNTSAATLASVPPFESTQQHWEEPKPYGESQSTPAVQPQQQNLSKEASLVFVKKSAASNANVPTISAGRDDESNVPQLNLTPGTRVQARLETQASTAVSAPVVAVVEYTYSLGDRVILPAGARVYGQLQQADRSGAVSIKFSEIELLDGNREKIEAIGTSLELGPIKGNVTGKNTGKNFLVRTASGIGSVAAMLVGNNTSTAFSEDDLIRERIAQNVGNAGDTEIMNLAVTNHIVVSVPADTPIYIVFTKRETGSSAARTSSNTIP